MSLPWAYSSWVAPRPLPAKDDEQLYIDPQVLTSQGGWISNGLQPPPSLFNAVGRALRESEAVRFNADRGVSHVPPTAPSALVAHRYGDACNGSPPSSPPTMNPVAQAFVPNESSFSWPASPEEPVQAVRGQCGQTGSSTPAILVHNVSEPCLNDGLPVRPTSTGKSARPRGQSSPAAAPDKGNFRMSPPPSIPHDTLLSPGDLFSEQPYHAGDRSALNTLNVPITPSPTPNPRHVANYDPATPSSPRRGPGPYYCDAEGCKEQTVAFNTMSDLKKHQRKHLTMAQRPHACPDCGRRFQYPKDVRRHRRAKVHDGDPVTCFVCNKLLSRGDNLTRHLASQHNIVDTPSIVSESSAGSPASVSVSSLSEAAYSYASPPSTGLSAPWSPARTSSYSIQRAPPWLDQYSDPFVDGSPRPLPASVAMARWHTN